MNKLLYAKYINPNSGFDSDKGKCQEYLKLNERYKISKISIGGWFTSIYLEGFKKSFNSVNFKIEDENGKEYDIFKDNEINPYL